MRSQAIKFNHLSISFCSKWPSLPLDFASCLALQWYCSTNTHFAVWEFKNFREWERRQSRSHSCWWSCLSLLILYDTLWRTLCMCLWQSWSKSTFSWDSLWRITNRWWLLKRLMWKTFLIQRQLLHHLLRHHHQHLYQVPSFNHQKTKIDFDSNLNSWGWWFSVSSCLFLSCHSYLCWSFFQFERWTFSNKWNKTQRTFQT